MGNAITTETIVTSTGVQTTPQSDFSVIGVIGTAGKGDVGVVQGFTGDGTTIFEEYGEYKADSATIPDAVDLVRKSGTFTACVINVCDPAVHNDTVTSELAVLNGANEAQLDNGYISAVTLDTDFIVTKTFLADETITLPSGITSVDAVKSSDSLTTYVGGGTDYTVASNVITREGTGAIAAGETVIVEYTATAVLNTDYTINADDGIINRVSTSLIIDRLATISVNYTFVDFSAVTQTDIVNSIEEFKNSQAKTGFTPRIFIAPGFAGIKPDTNTLDPVVSSLLTQAENLKGTIYVDVEETTVSAAINYRNDFNSKNVRLFNDKPGFTPLTGSVTVFRSFAAVAAGMRAAIDNDASLAQGLTGSFIPDCIASERKYDFNNSATSSVGTLNSNNITTIVNDGGSRFRVIGENTTTNEEFFTFEGSKRITDFLEVRAQEIAGGVLGQPLTGQNLDDLQEAISDDLDRYKGTLLNGATRVTLPPERNPLANLNQGLIYAKLEFTPVGTITRVTTELALTTRFLGSVLADAV